MQLELVLAKDEKNNRKSRNVSQKMKVKESILPHKESKRVVNW